MRSNLLACFWLSAALAATPAAPAQTNVWMLAPGFTVRELPVRLSNINNLRFTPDGRLTALAYDGRIHVLRDTDGDGLEDKDNLFWDKPTLSVPVGMAWSGDWLYVSSHGKVSRLRDTHTDRGADREEIVASGWPPTDVGSGGVDATAVTLDAQGNVYFGLLTADYSNPYRVKDGVSHYDLHGPRGTIQKLSAATKRLETIATGIRVPYTLAFNRLGDLFVTDQEGETWCPGGNPLDELNHIIPGRNYGFPPRHEKYLPDLISDPPIVAFGPQHQSSCGLVFNEATATQKLFGPAGWEGDAFVAGESRGKIWRVRLVKTPAGYVGKETILARLNMLTMDVAISPRGALYVCCHSGTPDWGTGPNGEGRLFQISHTDVQAPQIVAAWAAGPMEVEVAFDRAIDPSVTNHYPNARIDFGEFVRAADRLEVLKPPYSTVNYQEATPRGTLRVVAAKLSADHRTLALTTDPQPQSVTYALMLPGIKADEADTPAATVDTDYDLNGVEAQWSRDHAGTPDWSGWLPHVDSAVNEAFTSHSAGHERLFELNKQPGILRLRTRLSFPPARIQIRLDSNRPFETTLGSETRPAASFRGRYRADATFNSPAQADLLSVAIRTGPEADVSFHADYSTGSDPTIRPLPLNFLRVPWAPPHQPPPPPAEKAGKLAGGDFENGRGLFFGEKLKCSACHRVRGEGGVIGPDLSNLAQRDPASVLRDIKEPSAMINPDYVAYNVSLRDGGEVTGLVRAQTANLLKVVGGDGKEQSLATGEIKEMKPSAVSLMPAGLIDGLEENQTHDLLTFLLNEPPTRARSEIEAVLTDRIAGTPEANPPLRPLNMVLVASKQDHGPGQHDYPAWQKKWTPLLGQAKGVTVSDAWEWPTAKQFREADVVALYCWNHDWSAERLGQLDEFLARGGGLALFHAATIADAEPEKLAERIGLAAQPGPTKYRHTPFDLKFIAPGQNPITHGFQPLHLIDEPYWPMFGATNTVDVLATVEMEGQPRPMMWTFKKGKGRVFASIAGHYTWTFDDPLFRILVLRGLAWAAGESTDRFNALMRETSQSAAVQNAP